MIFMPDKLNGEQPFRKRQDEGSIPSSGSALLMCIFLSIREKPHGNTN